MRPLKITMNGVRGVVGETLTPELIINFAQAVGTFADGGEVLVSRDTRPSAPMVSACTFAGLLASGCRVVDLGICPTPAMQLAVARGSAVAGIAITAGHNSIEWTALKVADRDGLFLNRYQGEELLDIYHQGQFAKASWDGLHRLERDEHAAERHVQAILGLLDVETVRDRRLRVAVDCCNGACCEPALALLDALGCEVIPINDDPRLPSPRPPDPTRENVGQLTAIVKAAHVDVGFALDLDGRRLGIVTEEGEAPGPEMSLCLAADFVLSRAQGPVVTSLCTTMAVEQVARRHGAEVIRTRVGQAYVAMEVRGQRAAIGGEGSGGIMFPSLNCAYDSLAAMGFLLEHIAASGETVSTLVARIPRYSIASASTPCEARRLFTVFQRLRDEIEEDLVTPGTPTWQVDLQDGICLRTDEKWVHVRASSTEPVIRIIAEAPDPDEAAALNEEYLQRVRQAI
ncbi:MAG: phosphoglucosamine mutase [Armatimonadota bacterium]